MDQELITLSGTIEGIIFKNENNGWTVLEMDCGEELVTIVGTFFQISVGDELKVMGEWANHPSYGRQLKVHTFEKSLPATISAIFKYLASGAIKGIGPSTAKRIVDTFGLETLEIIETQPEKLATVRGISLKKANAVSDEYQQQFGVRSCMLFLQQYNVTSAEALRIWKHWGAAAVDMVKKDPYILCGAGLAISFERADAIANVMGFDNDDIHRIKAGILHVLRHNLFSGGHTYIPYDKLIAAAQELLNVSSDLAEDGINDLVEENELKNELVGDKKALFLRDAYNAERYVAGRLELMLSIKPPPLGESDKRIDEVEQKYNIQFADKQKQAIKTACSEPLMILTGGPGTGKTTALNAIIRVYEGMGLKVLLGAPTGRAAKRMSDVSDREAKTIHRLLEMEYTTDGLPRFSRSERNQLDCDALIIDELSMVDILLLESLLRALKLNCRLVMVGDADQLPPVGAGNALRDMIDSGRVPVVELDEIFRQAAESLIIINAHKIVKGEMPELNAKGKDFFFMQRYTAEQVKSTVRELVVSRLPAAYNYSPFWDIQVLVPGRKGEIGTRELNSTLQQALNPPDEQKAERLVGNQIFRLGDKVMQIKNNYDITWVRASGESGAGVFNGDVGVITLIDRRTGFFKIKYDDRIAEYGPETVEELELAYAVTVHKSQGSEFKAVILPLFSGAPQLFYRNLLYTAVTRAREMVIIVGRESTVAQMVQNNRKTKRYTGLCEFLKNGSL